MVLPDAVCRDLVDVSNRGTILFSVEDKALPALSRGLKSAAVHSLNDVELLSIRSPRTRTH